MKTPAIFPGLFGPGPGQQLDELSAQMETLRAVFLRHRR